jgi:16S rRNA (adenine1518-N6/adenine1519-N6)-dimethyltransferase
MDKVSPKKQLGQHFLTDPSIAQHIVDSLSKEHQNVMEIGPGMGVLTRFLLNRHPNFKAVDVDQESVQYLKFHYPESENSFLYADFLRLKEGAVFQEEYAIIGNFPYNISSQILFKMLDERNQVTELVGMFQREVARRVISPPGNKDYGILSVLIQAFYTGEYLFTVNEGSFNPPPKVKSGVIRLKRNEVKSLPCDETRFIRVVKAGFNQRRKTLRNALKSVTKPGFQHEFLDKRAEQLSVDDFVQLTLAIEE